MTFAAPRLQLPENSASRPFRGALRDLFATLDDLLACGGDSRLMLDPISRLNDYGCGPAPAPETLSFASSTASSISERGYERAGLAREELMRSAIAAGLEEALEDRIETMREELKALLTLPEAKVDVVFSPSGTDSQLHALALARSLLGPRLVSIVIGSDQTGSGTAYTARGRHFSRFTANGVVVRKDTAIAGLEGAGVALPLSDATGVRSRSDIDGAVLASIEAAVAGGRRALLQIMDASKLGWRAPSDACLDEIARRWPAEVLVVVDACQMRLSRRRLASYLDRGYLVLITGSKFFGGPAFSGALLVPSALSQALDGSEEMAAGLVDYASRSDWPGRWSRLRSFFESRANLGQWLRWEVALEEIRAYHQVPVAFRAMALRELGAGIESLITLSPSLRPICAGTGMTGADDEEFSEATIFPFTIERQGRSLSATDCRVLYHALAQDLGEVIAGSRPDRAVLARRCLLGQPVRIERQGLEPTAALRLCVGARLVTEAWSTDAVMAARSLHRELDHIAETVAKIELLLAHTDVTQLTELSDGI
ncbi:MAG TPA: hypothetical protein VKR55_00980 [Bradyrhizobium sp.]|uniref:hypothetical protein n=1 Tax=Bradyrhizobium sp. TaxID=376 RepID=UPI002B6E0753|nr:hypothetical protein [Bradyrhizobium sp.]HLZ00703.1 hypothetical protein [Bradyrhizobium sp.]